MADKWNKVGLALRLDPSALSRVRKNFSDVEDCLQEVLTQWLQKAYNTTRFGDPSWKLLVEAVAHPAGGNNPALAQQIALKYNGRCSTLLLQNADCAFFLLFQYLLLNFSECG